MIVDDELRTAIGNFILAAFSLLFFILLYLRRQEALKAIKEGQNHKTVVYRLWSAFFISGALSAILGACYHLTHLKILDITVDIALHGSACILILGACAPFYYEHLKKMAGLFIGLMALFITATFFFRNFLVVIIHQGLAILLILIIFLREFFFRRQRSSLVKYYGGAFFFSILAIVAQRLPVKLWLFDHNDFYHFFLILTQYTFYRAIRSFISWKENL